jgi:hypothetical protein
MPENFVFHPAFRLTKMSSGALTPGCAVAHSVMKPRPYVIYACRDNVRLASVALNVSDNSGTKQVDFDLFALHRTGRSRALDTPSLRASYARALTSCCMLSTAHQDMTRRFTTVPTRMHRGTAAGSPPVTSSRASC